MNEAIIAAVCLTLTFVGSLFCFAGGMLARSDEGSARVCLVAGFAVAALAVIAARFL